MIFNKSHRIYFKIFSSPASPGPKKSLLQFFCAISVPSWLAMADSDKLVPWQLYYCIAGLVWYLAGTVYCKKNCTMKYDFLRRVLQKLKGCEKNKKSLYFRLKNYPNKSIFKDNLIFTDHLNKAVVFFAVEIFPKKDAVQKTRCFTYRTTPVKNAWFRLKNQWKSI